MYKRQFYLIANRIESKNRFVSVNRIESNYSSPNRNALLSRPNTVSNIFDKTSIALRCVSVLTCSRRDDDDASMKISRQSTSIWKTEDDDDDDDYIKGRNVVEPKSLSNLCFC